MNELNPIVTGCIDVSIILVLIVGIWQFRTPRQARSGNLTAACALLCASILILYRNGIIDTDIVIISLIAGAVIGYGVARAVTMIQIPSMVAFQHGMGGIAAFLISLVELTRATHTLDRVSEISGILGLTIGSLTFSGSMIAGAKLSNTIRQTPHILPAHSVLVIINIVALVAVGSLSLYVPDDMIWYILGFQIILAAVFGILFSIRIGGADMPVVISFLNATAGLAAAFCGMVTGNRLLIAFGATVAASGSILTHVMCNAMNRSLIRIFFPRFKKQTGSSKLTSSQSDAAPTQMTGADDRFPTGVNTDDAVAALVSAKTVIIIPGYGMALAKAQFKIVELAWLLREKGARVKYAIHPVAGRMPGHMNVILAEAEVDYDDLLEMDEVNPIFSETDVALVVGACDVVNPAAIQQEGTPISGMPILTAHEAKQIIICNYDRKPGYSGVENPLYDHEKTIFMPGDAKETADRLIASIRSF